MRKLIPLFLTVAVLAALIVNWYPGKQSLERNGPGPGVDDRISKAGSREPEALWQQRYREWLSGLDPGTRLKLIRQEYERHKAEAAWQRLGPADAAAAWVSLGPTNGAGRINAIAFSQDDLQTIYAGSETGGVWKSTDSGVTWTPLTDSIPSMEVGSIAVAPSSPKLVYVGSGAGRFSGIGLIKSTDAGATWELPSAVVGGNIWGISVHPSNPNELVIGTDIGGYLSTDGGATWSQVIPDHLYGVIRGLIRNPRDPALLYATTDRRLAGQNYVAGVVLKSTDAGRTWAEKTAPLSFYRISIAISPSAPQVLYASAALTASETSRDISTHVFKSTDAGETWSDLPSAISNVTGGAQTTHNNAIVVSPNNPDVVNIGGVWYMRSTDGGVTWNPTPFSGSVHGDATDMRYRGNTLFVANDGGLWSSPDDGATATPHNAGLVVRQYYTVASDPSDRARLIAGCQDNGTDVRPATGDRAFTPVIGGDGFDCAISSVDPAIAYATFQYGSILRTRSGGENPVDWQYITPHYGPNDPAPFATVLKMDPVTATTLYTATSRVWRTTDGGDSWIALPTTTSDGSIFDNQQIIDLAVGRADDRVLMFHNGLSIFRSTNAGSTWGKISLPPSAVPLGIDIDPNDSYTIYAIVAPETPGQPNFTVFMSTDGGTTWRSSHNGLPPVFLSSLRVDPSDSSIIYCGTSAGVYRSTDRGSTWSSFNVGLPNVAVTAFAFSSDGSLLRVATFGRGIWQIQIRPSEPDFSIGFDQPSVGAGPGTKVRATVNISRSSGLSQSVTVTPPGQVAGIKSRPADPVTTTDSSVTFKLKISGAASPGQYQLTFTARDDTGRTRAATLTLVVQ
jgi:photosystem II stability/assembly factor-like uncharacterized protein